MASWRVVLLKGLAMHIVHVMASGAQGGGADHLLALLPALQACGVGVSAWVGDDGPLASQLQALNIAATAHPLMGHRLDVRAARRMVLAASRAGATAVHAHGTRAGVLAALGTALTPQRMPRIYTAHGLAHRVGRTGLHRQVRLLAERVACLGARGVVSVSRTDLGVLCDQGFVSCAQAFHVPNVVRLPRGDVHAALDPDARARAQARAAWGLPPKGQVVGTVSRLVPQKNVSALADAVACMPNTHLVVVGDGPLRAPLAAHALAQAGRLHLWGSQNDVPSLLPLFDVFALASRWEGEPIALLEAMAMGLPWVATTTAGAQEIAAASHCGTLVPQNAPAAFANALQALFKDPALYAAHKRAGIQAMAARRPQELAAQIAAVYQQVLL